MFRFRSNPAIELSVLKINTRRLEWVARNLGATFVDPNSWIRDGDSGMDGLHLNRNGARQLGDLYSRVCKIDGESRKGLNN